MDIDRDELVGQLRAGAHRGLLDKLGIDDSIIDKIPGGLADKKLRDIL